LKKLKKKKGRQADREGVMIEEEKIQQELTDKFKCLEGKGRVQRDRRIYIEVPLEDFTEVFSYAVKKMDFPILCTITGLDEGDNLGFIYHLAKENGIILNLKTLASKTNPVIKTVTSYFPGAENYERELIDLLGAKVEGLGEGNRYPLPDSWPKDQHPLRKDWKPQQP
jgi:membrane-bound hydrogenase subunit beta